MTNKAESTAEYLVAINPHDIRKLIEDCERYCIDESDVVKDSFSFTFEDGSLVIFTFKEDYMDVETM